MKGKEVIFSKETDEWKTPPNLVKFINKNFKIDIDPCCSVFNVRAKRHYTIKENGLIQDWFGTVYMNPPYSEAKKWIVKAYSEFNKGNCKKVICLIFAKTETTFFQDFAFKANYICFIRGRLKFQRPNKRKTYPAPFGSALIIFGKINRFQYKELTKLGYLMVINKSISVY